MLLLFCVATALAGRPSAGSEAGESCVQDTLVVGHDASTWASALLSSMLIGLVGLLPLYIIPLAGRDALTHVMPRNLRTLVGIAAGGLLGDVFLHILPESAGDHSQEMVGGLWVITGIMSFLVLEKLAAAISTKDSVDRSSNARSQNDAGCSAIAPSGYLTLVVNSLDNFTHGLAVAGSHCLGVKAGLLTTVTILIHEIPHEIGDFAILVKSGFRRRDAIRAQFITSAGGIAGTCVGLLFSEAGARSSWILPFTAGGFLYIALVTIVPELLRTDSPTSGRDVLHVGAGIAFIWLATTVGHLDKNHTVAVPLYRD